jgi:hypothetical protein
LKGGCILRLRLPPKPSLTSDSNQRIEEAEQQTSWIKNKKFGFETDLTSEEELIQSELTRLPKDKESESKTKGMESQTLENLSTFRDRKNMIVSGTRDAPKFLSTKPRELR